MENPFHFEKDLSRRKNSLRKPFSLSFPASERSGTRLFSQFRAMPLRHNELLIPNFKSAPRFHLSQPMVTRPSLFFAQYFHHGTPPWPCFASLKSVTKLPILDPKIKPKNMSTVPREALILAGA